MQSEYEYLSASGVDKGGWLVGFDASDYPTARTNADAANKGTTGAIVYIGQILDLAGYAIYRGSLWFDLSSVSEDDNINSGRLVIYCDIKLVDNDFDVVVVSGLDLDSPLVDADYGELLDETTSHGSINTADITEDETFEITLNPAGLAALTKGGWHKFAFRSSKDISGITPGATPSIYDEIICRGNESGLPSAQKARLYLDIIPPSKHHHPTHPTEPRHGLEDRRMG